MNHRRSRKRLVACQASDLPPGKRLIVELEGKSIGLFNVDGRYYALHNRCPHMGGPLCEGPLAGTALPTEEHEFVYGHEGRVLRCGWHGWEYDLESGRAMVDPKMRARTYRVSVEDGSVLVHI